MLKDFALQYGFGAPAGKFSLRKLLRPVLYAPPSMPLAVLLQKMQAERVHMALVIDEYGGVDGLVTIEDLLETVVGDISDEHDTEEGAFWIAERPGCYVAQARAPLEAFEAEIGFGLRNGEDDEDIDTLGGLVFLRAGRVPARGEVVQHESGAVFEVLDADPRRIKRLRVRLPGAAGAARPATAAE
jgi:magnesium and cobalt transporter